MIMNNYDSGIEEVIGSVISFFNVDRDLLFGNSRKAEIVEARHVLAYCLRNKFRLSFPAIGEIFNRDHTSIMHACENACIIIERNIKLKVFIDNLINSGDSEYKDISEVEGEDVGKVVSEDIKTTNNPEELKKYLTFKRELEDKEHERNMTELRKNREGKISNAKAEYAKAVINAKNEYENNSIKLIEGRAKNIREHRSAMFWLKIGRYSEANEYLSPKKELLENNDFKKDIVNFLPKFKTEVKELVFPIEFNKEYLRNCFADLDDRSKNILIKRYGFDDEKTSTLEEIAVIEKISRERVRQILQTGINKIYFNNCGGLRQVVNSVAGKILKEDLVFIDKCLNEFFIFNKEDESLLRRLILVIMLSVKWIKEFDFSGYKFFINSSNEKKVIEQIDHIKLLIGKIEAAMPDMILDRWQYVLNNLKLYEFFQDKKHLLDDAFLRACYDNFLFESEIVVYKTEVLKKYKSYNDADQEQVEGVPNEYNVFFE